MELSITKVNGFQSFGSLVVSKMEYFLSISTLKNSYILDIGVLDPPIFDTGIRDQTFLGSIFYFKMIESGHIEICLTILTGKNCVLLNSVKEWLFLMYIPFSYICLRSPLRSINPIRGDTHMTSTLMGGGG